MHASAIATCRHRHLSRNRTRGKTVDKTSCRDWLCERRRCCSLEKQKYKNQKEERANKWETVICAFIKGCWSNFPSETMHAEHQEACMQVKMTTCWFIGTQNDVPTGKEKTKEKKCWNDNYVFKWVSIERSKLNTVIGQPEEREDRPGKSS